MRLLLACLFLPLALGLGILEPMLKETVQALFGKIYDNDEFDYIVVGAGAAGTAAAYRLADRGASVLLVEAGGEPSILTQIPGAAMAILGSPEDWQYDTVPNNISCLSSRDQACRFSRGKCLGGSTSINYMMYIRGNREDYDLPISGWTWKDLEPYFLKYEGLRDLDELPETSEAYHNTTGIMDIEFFDKSKNKWHHRIIDGFKSLSFPLNFDVNGASQIGVSHIIGYVYKNERMSSSRAYLSDDKIKNLNLTIAKNTKCSKVILNDDNEAIGIEVLYGLLEVPLKLFARQEVLISAGTVGTPQILMLSGIGPSDHLEQFDIKVRSDLPVGNNLKDHVLPLIILEVERGIGDPGPNPFALGELLAQGADYALFKQGEIATIGLTDVTAFANTDCYDFDQKQLTNNDSNCEFPNLQYVNAYLDKNLLTGIELIFQQSVNLNSDIVRQLSDANRDHAFIIVSPVLLQPKSQGKIHLASTDPSDDPLIFANYLSKEEDVEDLLKSIFILEDLIDTPAYRNHNASILHLKFDECPNVEEDRAGYWRCYVRHMTYSVFHAVGTAQLGKVLDACMNVRGVHGLRVADLSAAPRLPRGNPGAFAIALGERVADFMINGCDFK